MSDQIKPFGYFCDWGDADGVQRIAMYYGGPGSAIEDDWNEIPSVHRNIPLYSPETVQHLQEQNARLLEALKNSQKGFAAVEELIEHSEGVYGLHLNGDLAPWIDLRMCGRFEEWLIDFDAAAENIDTIIAEAGESVWAD